MSAREPLLEVYNGVSIKPKVRATYGRRKGISTTQSLFSVHDHVLDRDLSNHPTSDTSLTAYTFDSIERIITPRNDHGNVRKVDEVSQIDDQNKDKDVATCESDAPAKVDGASGHVRNRRPRRVRAKDPVKAPAFDLSALSKCLPITGEDPDRSSRLKVGVRTISSADLTAIQPLFEVSGLARPISFSRYGSSIAKFYHMRKIGEGTYSSVFELKRKDDVCVQKCPNESTVLKVMPLLLPTQESRNASLRENQRLEGLTSAGDVVKELHTMRGLDPLPGFLRYRGVALTTGAWPCSFVDSFRKYAQKCPSKSFNADPEEAYQADQCYAIIEMGHAGIELDEIKRPSDFLIYDVFWQTALHLARAEEVAEFEHRDMHLSNICIHTSKPEADIDKHLVRDMHANPSCLLGLTGTKVAIIDYTYSRVKIHDGGDTFINYRECEMQNWVINNTQATKFEDQLQFSTYVEQANLLVASTTEPVLEWHRFEPRTNIIWLSYLIQTLLSRAGKIKRTRYVAGSSETAIKVQDRLRMVMTQVRDFLSRSDIDERKADAGADTGKDEGGKSEKIPDCTTRFIEIAIQKGWISKREIETYHQRTIEEDK